MLEKNHNFLNKICNFIFLINHILRLKMSNSQNGYTVNTYLIERLHRSEERRVGKECRSR